LIVSGEESLGQIKMRADRLGAVSDDLYLLAETNIEAVKAEIEKLRPALVIVDSIQTMYHPDISSAPGSVSQIRESASFLSRMGKQQGFSLFFIGHVTKEGAIAGPRILEHMVDTVLYFEGDGRELYRVIRAVKNRFGSTNEVGVFEMSEAGLREVTDPSSFFLKDRTGTNQGSIILATLEGTRPLLVEVQALVTSSYLAMPRRLSTGLDFNRFSLVTAVLERRAHANLSHQDIYVNIGGGIKVVEPAADLAIALAIFSAFKDLELPAELLTFGEVSLSGEVRTVSRTELRLKEAVKLGFKKVIMPVYSGKVPEKSLQIYPVRTLREAVDVLKRLAVKDKGQGSSSEEDRIKD
jgi:DNA repair protein RadA/Sms